MEITDVRVRLARWENDRLRGYCTITLDHEFVVRDLRIIAGERGLFVAMPSRKSQVKCRRCGHKNNFQARFCNECGVRLKPPRKPRNKSRLHVDVAHPITPECRTKIQKTVLKVFDSKAKSRRDGNGQHPEDEREDSYGNYEEDDEKSGIETL